MHACHVLSGFVDTVMEPGVSAIFPSNVPVFRCPLSSTGSLGLVPPLRRYYQALRLPAALPALLGFLRFAVPALCLGLRSRSARCSRTPVSRCLAVVRGSHSASSSSSRGCTRAQTGRARRPRRRRTGADCSKYLRTVLRLMPARALPAGHSRPRAKPCVVSRALDPSAASSSSGACRTFCALRAGV
jgi:hypothetical protein